MGRTPDLERGNGRTNTSRRRVLQRLSTIIGGLSLASIATATRTEVDAADPPTPSGHVRPMAGQPKFLPPGVKARAVRIAGTCSPQAEYVGSNICVDGFCCTGNMYRQQCLDDGGNPYYTYFCA